MTHLIVRADAPPGLGTGHVMRCLALADAWQKDGGSVSFVTASAFPAVIQRVAAAGFDVVSPPSVHPATDDAKTLVQAARTAGRETWIVADGYHFNANFQRAVRQGDARLMVIDDHAPHAEYPANLLLNQNLDAHRIAYVTAPDTVRLLGCAYALVRPEFHAAHESQRHAPVIARRLLVSVGGEDPNNVTGQVLAAITKAQIHEMECRVVVGPANPHHETLVAQSDELRDQGLHIQLVQDADMPALMRWAELAVTAAGSTSWELAYMGVPSLSVVIAPNQARIASALARHGISIALGASDQMDLDGVAHHVQTAVTNQSWRLRAIERGQALVDGNGATRVVAALRDHQGD